MTVWNRDCLEYYSSELTFQNKIYSEQLPVRILTYTPIGLSTSSPEFQMICHIWPLLEWELREKVKCVHCMMSLHDELEFQVWLVLMDFSTLPSSTSQVNTVKLFWNQVL